MEEKEDEEVSKIIKIGDDYYISLECNMNTEGLHEFLVLYKLTLEYFKNKYPELKIIAWRPQFSAERDNYLEGLMIKAQTKVSEGEPVA